MDSSIEAAKEPRRDDFKGRTCKSGFYGNAKLQRTWLEIFSSKNLSLTVYGRGKFFK